MTEDKNIIMWIDSIIKNNSEFIFALLGSLVIAIIITFIMIVCFPETFDNIHDFIKHNIIHDD